MKTIVTGGTGFIGSNLVKRLLDEGRDVTVASDFSRFGMENLSELGVRESDVEVRDADLVHFSQALEAIKGADAVFHLAARVGSLEYLHLVENAELIALQSNLAIDANIFRACQEQGVKKLVYASSCAVYAMDNQFTGGTVLSETELQFSPSFKPESSPGNLNPDGGYGWSKLMGELQLCWTRGMDIGIARIFNIFGINEPLQEGKSHVVADLIKKVVLHPDEPLEVYGDGTQSRDFLYVSDCADALIKLEGKASNPPVIVNIGSGRPVSVGTLAETIVKISGKQIPIEFDTSKEIGPVSRAADTTRAGEILGWQPALSIEEGLERTYRWIENRLTR